MGGGVLYSPAATDAALPVFSASAAVFVAAV